MLLSNTLSAGALLGHIPWERCIYGCLCMFLASKCFDVALQMEKRCQDVTEKLSVWSGLFRHVLPCIYPHLLFISIPFGCA